MLRFFLVLGMTFVLVPHAHGQWGPRVERTEASLPAVDLRFQLVEEADGAISQNAINWLPDFVAESSLPDGIIRVDSASWAFGVVANDRDVLARYIEWLTPRCSMIPQFAVGRVANGSEERPRYELYVLEGTPWLTAADIANASIGTNDWGDVYVSVEFTQHGKTVFGSETGHHVGRKLAILLDGEVMSAPVIREAIPGGRAQITLGAGSPGEKMQEAQRLVAQLTGRGDTEPVVAEPFRDPAVAGLRLLTHIGWTLVAVPGLPTGHWAPVFFGLFGVL
jgi:hypothetical protein